MDASFAVEGQGSNGDCPGPVFNRQQTDWLQEAIDSLSEHEIQIHIEAARGLRELMRKAGVKLIGD